MDAEIQAVIEALGNKGICPICGAVDSYIYNTDSDVELMGYFDELIGIYSTKEDLPANYPIAQTAMLKEEMLHSWNIFSPNLTAGVIYEFLKSVCPERYSTTPSLFDNPVGIAEIADEDFLKEFSLLRTNEWSDFVQSLKTRNRFHTRHINLDILATYCSYIRKPYKAGETFFRGRIAPTKQGYEPKDMGAPPSELASAGRVNSFGIPCLYLANDTDTVIHEIRAGAFDYIAVGKFILKEDIIVVNLKSIDRISPFIEEIDYLGHAINKEHLKTLNAEMGKALRRSDSILDYVPTQYISDFIKSIEHDNKPEYAGIEYNSTMHKEGYNVAIYYPDLFECVEVKTYRINDLVYHKQNV